jgi:hypothetical protein
VPEVTPTATPKAGVCTGDCDGDGQVTIDELMAGIVLALGGVGDAPCAAAFCHADCGPGPGGGRVGVACLIAAVGRALDGCPAAACGTDADCDDGNNCTADRCSEGACASACLCF